MKSLADRSYLDLYAKLPLDVQRQAREAFKLFQQDANHPSLHFKRIRSRKNTYSVRVSDQYRALAYEQNGELHWYWIGTHNDYCHFENYMARHFF